MKNRIKVDGVWYVAEDNTGYALTEEDRENALYTLSVGTERTTFTILLDKEDKPWEGTQFIEMFGDKEIIDNADWMRSLRDGGVAEGSEDLPANVIQELLVVILLASEEGWL